MFDISFSELMLIAVVALLVIGPEKLPKVARTTGLFIGKLQRYISQVKEEINRDGRFEELQKLQKEIEFGAQSIKQDLNMKQHIVSDPYQTTNGAENLDATTQNADALKRKLKRSAYLKRENFRKVPLKQTLKNHLKKKVVTSGK